MSRRGTLRAVVLSLPALSVSSLLRVCLASMVAAPPDATTENPATPVPEAPDPVPDPPAEDAQRPAAPVPEPPDVLPEPDPTRLALQLHWEAPADCPTRAEVLDAVAELVRMPVDPDAEPEVVADADVRTTDDGLTLQLDVTTDDGRQQRTLRSPRCRSLADATALVVATAVYPERAATTLREREAAAQSRDRPIANRTRTRDRAAPAQAKPTEPTAPAPSGRRLRGAVRVAGGPAFAVVPGVSGGVFGTASLLVGQARVEAVGGHWFSQSATAEGLAVAARLTTGGLRGCYAPTMGRIEVPVCGGIALGAMHGQGEGELDASRSSRQLWVGLDAGPGFVFAITEHWVLHAAVDAVVALRRPGFHVDVAGESREIYRAAPAGARILVGVEARFP
jgi:hypothetical protein